MRRTRTRKRRRKQRGGFNPFDALKAGLANGLGALGLKKKEQPIVSDATTEIQNTSVNTQEGGKRRRRKSRRRKSRRRKSRRGRKSRRSKRRRR